MERKIAIFVMGWVLLFLTQACAEISYTGSEIIGKKILPALKDALYAKSKVEFGSVITDSSSMGLPALIQGKVDLVGLARRLTSQERRQHLFYQIIAYDAIVVCVHQKNPVNNLSKEQIKGIFSGKIASWSEVGGNDIPIVCIIQKEQENRGTMIEFRRQVMDDVVFRSDAQEILHSEEQAEILSKTEGGITVLSQVFLPPEIKRLAVDGVFPGNEATAKGFYLLSRPLILMARELPGGELKTFFDFVIS
ncbi:MAG: substrate-binding domain-containing protein, partial [Candidatus Omnitrophica bacterium]|nr:substrate-binding domain-containing protein [Candidatus Omnitrophota bacterium]